MNVSAKDKTTGKAQSIVIKASSGLSDAEVEAMIQDAKNNAEADKKFHEVADARNKADSLAHSTEKSLKDLGDKVDAQERIAIEALISELKELIKGDDKEAIESKTEALSQKANQIAQQAYSAEKTDPSHNGGEESSEKRADDNVVDAEFEEMKDDEKKEDK
jgi:molecular chaperone DnaK